VDLNLAQFEQQVKANFPHLHLHWRRVMGQIGAVTVACIIICCFLQPMALVMLKTKQVQADCPHLYLCPRRATGQKREAVVAPTFVSHFDPGVLPIHIAWQFEQHC
jgi:hypothetical protein